MNTGVLIICFGPLGRLVDALAAVQRLRAHAPRQSLTLLTTPALAILARASSLFDAVSTIKPPQTPQALRKLVTALKKRRFARVYDLQRDALTAQIHKAMGFFGPPFAGSGKRSRWRLDAVPPHPVDADALLLNRIGIGGVQDLPAAGPDGRFLLRRRGGAPSLKPAFFGLERDFVLLNLSREAEGPRWPAARFLALGRAVLRSGLDCAIVGVMADRACAREVVMREQGIKDLCARADFFQLAALGAQAQAMIGHGGAAARLACAAGGRVISLHEGHADAEAHAPRGPGTVALVSPKLAALEASAAFDLLSMFITPPRQGAA